MVNRNRARATEALLPLASSAAFVWALKSRSDLSFRGPRQSSRSRDRRRRQLSRLEERELVAVHTVDSVE
jgi:hypothetical protein